MIMKLFTAKENFQKIKRNNFKRIQLKVSSEIEPSWMKISTEITKIANVKLSEIPRLFELDIRTVELIKFNEFAIENGTVYCGSFLSGGKFLFVNYSGDETCSVFDQNWDSIHVIGGLNKPYGAVQFEGEIFVTNTVSKTIDVFSSVYFQKLRNFQLNCNFRGIICWGGNLYVACVTHILKLDQMGHTLQTYNVVGNNILHITTTRSGLIVYTDCRLETVTAIDDTGREVWIYKTCDLKQPMELDIDSNNNIYIAGYISNNIHVLSSSGRRIRVIENIPSPTFCKINEDEGIMCVCSGHKNIKLYHLQPTM